MKFGVLVSGRGSNLGALLRHKANGQLPCADFAVVVSNVAGVRALDIAAQAGVPAETVDSRRHPRTPEGRAAHEQEVLARLRAHGVEAVVLAGYMRIVGAQLLGAFPHRILNIHPALLPSFPGLHAQRQALEHGVKVSGCTVHLVDAGCDTGPILLQAAVAVLPDDTEDSLSARILAEEHRVYAIAVDAMSRGRVRVSSDGRRAWIADSDAR